MGGWGPGAAVVLFGRAPGEGKTRLAAGCGAGAARRLYAAAARGGALEAAAGLPGARRRVFCAAGADPAPCAAWLRGEGALRAEGGGGGGGGGRGGVLGKAGPFLDALERQDLSAHSLGGRMAAAFEAEFARGAERVLLVGTDVPSVSSSLLADALVALQRHDVVLGPAHDGGYYLVGLAAGAARGRCARLFAGIDWSSPEVLAQQLANARLLGLRAAPVEGARAPLPVLVDVDTAEDLRLWVQQADSRERNPAFFEEAVATLWRLDRPAGSDGAGGGAGEGARERECAAAADSASPAGGEEPRSPLPKLVASWLGPQLRGGPSTWSSPAASAAAPAGPEPPRAPPALSPTPYGVRPLTPS